MKERNYGIDLLRIFSMLMVVTLHVMNAGGVLKSTELMSTKYELASALQIATYCAVNCYALISGYVGLNSKFKVSNILFLWLQVLFYTVGFALLFAWWRPDVVNIKDIIYSMFPLATKQYWYFSSYFVCFLFMPFLNMAVQKLSQKQLRIILIGFVIACSVLPTVFNIDFMGLKNGYSAIWLMVLYVFGAYFKKYKTETKHSSFVYFLIYLLMIGITWGSRYLENRYPSELISNFSGKNMLINYTSVTMLVAGIALLLCFASMKIRFGKGLIALFSPYAFGVYLVHTNPMVWNHLFKNAFVRIVEFRILKMSALIVVAVLGIYCACTVVDMLRGGLFKLLHIRNLTGWIDRKIGFAQTEANGVEGENCQNIQ